MENLEFEFRCSVNPLPTHSWLRLVRYKLAPLAIIVLLILIVLFFKKTFESFWNDRASRRGVKRAMTMLPNAEARLPLGVSIRLARNDDVSAIRAVLFCVRSEYGVLGEIGASDHDLDDLELSYFRGGGCFEVVEDAANRIIGCVGLFPLNPCRAELCKMYLEKSARGHGLGKRLLEDALAAARCSGFREVWLKTNSALTEAIALYRKYGFQPLDMEHLPPRCDVAYLLRLE